MLPDVADLRRHQVEVVEQPFGRRRDRLSRPHVVGQRAIGLAQDARVVVEAREDVARARPRAGIDGEARGERERPLIKAFDAEQLVAERFLGRGRCPAPESAQIHRAADSNHIASQLTASRTAANIDVRSHAGRSSLGAAISAVAVFTPADADGTGGRATAAAARRGPSHWLGIIMINDDRDAPCHPVQ